MSTAETLASINERSLEALTTAQNGILDAYKTAAEALPLDRLPAVGSLVPFDAADVAEVVKEGYAFQTKVLEANKSFTLGLLGVARPSKPAAKSAK